MNKHEAHLLFFKFQATNKNSRRDEAQLYLEKYLHRLEIHDFKILRPPHRAPIIETKPKIYISHSHSKEIGVWALAKRPIGVDIEYKDEKRPMKKILRRYSLSPSSLKEAYRCWCRIEAFYKLHQDYPNPKQIKLSSFNDFEVYSGQYLGSCLSSQKLSLKKIWSKRT